MPPRGQGKKNRVWKDNRTEASKAAAAKALLRGALAMPPPKEAQGSAGGGPPTFAVSALVERFDIEFFSDFSAKRANFRGLVLFCIDAKFCKQIFVGKLLTRSTRFIRGAKKKPALRWAFFS